MNKPKVLTLEGVKELLDYVRKGKGNSEHGFLDDNIFSKKEYYRKKVYLEADVKTRDEILNKYDKYDGMPYYKIPLYDKYLKDSIDEYNDSKNAKFNEINVNGEMEVIPDFKNIYEIIKPNDKRNYTTPVYMLNEELEYFVIKHIGRDFKKNIHPILEMNVGAVIPYAIPKRVRKPRALKEYKEPKAPKAPKATKPMIMVEPTLINMNDKMAAAKVQKRIDAAIKISNAIKSKIVRTAIKNSTANKAMNKAGDVLAGNTIARMIKAKVSRDKTEAKNNVPVPKEPKPKFKMSYAAALKQWNMSRGEKMWCSPKKNSVHWKEIQALRL